MKTIFSIILSLLITSAQAGMIEGYDAFDKGDHKTAIFHFKQAIEEKVTQSRYKWLGFAYNSESDGIDNDYKKTFEAFNKVVTDFDTYATPLIYTYLGNMYYFGKGTDLDYKKAVEMYELAIKHKDYNSALWMLGKAYLHGSGVEQDYQKARALFLRADAKNDGNSQFELGHLYEYGKGVDVDISTAIKYYQKAAENGDADAQYKVDIHTNKIPKHRRNLDFETALDYSYGFILPLNYEKAIEHYQKAADNGHVTSIYNIGFLISYYSPVKRYKEASQYYLTAAERGNIYGQTVISSRYYLGKGVEQSLEKSVYWDKQAALQGNVDSMNQVAHAYYSGDGVDKSYAEAMTWYQKAVDHDSVSAIYDLALMYETGEGTDKNFDRALELYTQAAEAGHDKAQNELSDIYFKGERASVDYKKSFKWAKKAAEQGFSDAQNKMGIFYSSGKNVVEIDMDKAFEWLKKSAEQSNKKAYNNLAGFYATGVGVKRSKSKAFKWYKKGADLGDAESQYEIGRFYDFGYVVQKDVKEAIKWYEKSASQDYKKAEIILGTTYYYGDEDSNIPKNYKKAADWYYTAAKNTNDEDGKSMDIKITSSGSGFFVTPTHIITNNHVTAGCDEIEVKNKGYRSTVELLDTDSTTDLSILVTGNPNTSFLHLRNRKPVVTGEQSIALGYPFSSTLGSELKVTSGNIAALTGFNNNIAELQLTSPVQPGNSGGPLLDDNGNVIGVIVARLEKSEEITGDRPAQNVNFAIKSNMAKIFMDLNRVDYQVRKANGPRAVSEIVTEAKEATVQVICKEKE